MRSWPFVVAMLVGVLWVGDARAAIQVHLLDSDLSAGPGTGPGALSLGAKRVDDGGAGGTGAYLLQGCASLGTSLVVSFGIGLVGGLVGAAVLLGGAGSAGATNAFIAIVAITGVVAALVVPFATAGVVTWLAGNDGARPNYWHVYLASIATRVVLALLNFVLPTTTVVTVGGTPTATYTGLGYAFLVVSALLPAAVEVYVANFGFGGAGGDAIRQARAKARHEALAAASAVHRDVQPAVERPQSLAMAPTPLGFGFSF